MSRRQWTSARGPIPRREARSPPELEDLLVDGEEQEYFLELLMRRVSPERLKESPPTGSKTLPTKDRKSKGKRKKAR